MASGTPHATPPGRARILHGSRATLENCLFAGNLANLGVDYVGMLSGGEYHPEHGSGALTVFARSRVSVTRCTFTDNWNGVDDDGSGSTYVDSIFWKNTRPGGISAGPRYELDIVDAAGVRGSFIHGDVNDLRAPSTEANTSIPRIAVRPASCRRRRVRAWGNRPVKRTVSLPRPLPLRDIVAATRLGVGSWEWSHERQFSSRPDYRIDLDGPPLSGSFQTATAPRCRRLTPPRPAEVQRIQTVRQDSRVSVERLGVCRTAGCDLTMAPSPSDSTRCQ